MIRRATSPSFMPGTNCSQPGITLPAPTSEAKVRSGVETMRRVPPGEVPHVTDVKQIALCRGLAVAGAKHLLLRAAAAVRRSDDAGVEAERMMLSRASAKADRRSASLRSERMLAFSRAGGGWTGTSKWVDERGLGEEGADAAKRSEKEKAGVAPLLLKMLGAWPGHTRKAVCHQCRMPDSPW